MLSEVWTTLSGLSGVCLACSLLSAAVVLRWTRSQTARGAVNRARQKQRAGLETMDKAVQRFRLQVKAGAWARVGWRGKHGVGKAATSTARTPEGRLAGSADVSPGNRTPPPTPTPSLCIPYSFCARCSARGSGKEKDRWWRLGTVLGQRGALSHSRASR